MSSMSRTIGRNMSRFIASHALKMGRLICPKCGKVLHRKRLSLRKVVCDGCGFQGRMK
jgi:predicted RNA-binding Zn-ribbon protein involved in translation (DUF1610 family)